MRKRKMSETQETRIACIFNISDLIQDLILDYNLVSVN